jgi:hypothetical protein
MDGEEEGEEGGNGKVHEYRFEFAEIVCIE